MKKFGPLLKETGPEPFQIDHRDWNDIAEWIYEHRPLRIRAARPESNHKHAWRTNVAWDYRNEVWTAEVHPGYVRGIVSRVTVPEPFVSPLTFERLEYDAARKPNPDKTAEALLSEYPRIPIGRDLWRDVASKDKLEVKGQDSRPIPAILIEEFNVIASKLLVIDTAALEIKVDESKTLEQNSKTVRQLRSVELILTLPRPTISTAETEDPSLQGALALSPIINFPRNPIPRLRVFRDLPDQLNPTGASEDATALTAMLQASASEEMRRICTIWLLGPPGDLETKEPNASWTPIVQYQTWFNLDHTINAELETLPPLRILNPALGLAGGEAVQPLVDGINRANALAEAALSNAKIEGGWWTV